MFDPTVYYLAHLPARLDWHEVAQIIVMALVLSLLATLYPSWRAARTDPVEALRNVSAPLELRGVSRDVSHGGGSLAVLRRPT